eukprot:CAMPEP_0185772708 /NCGR_PEP_ID=MMETSP1174-20130828/70364_1 /TAXON_ID=35687 /ORGANISM="Dictyocha speculum, Strain CCMP1381" /LENGTH=61 /DNA_ID=CAMNT_0028459111 /DNA_START=278 /DNA_END=463 /DNA_ORIENTATION=-
MRLRVLRVSSGSSSAAALVPMGPHNPLRHIKPSSAKRFPAFSSLSLGEEELFCAHRSVMPR